ncbi:restriction endonuclease [Methanolobus sp. ZRKC3]|uniref:restriction endonuclease n=1 Tax=Methanolobus sp. ZRKC3 TaxID=3125786 RepID=UPI00324447F8
MNKWSPEILMELEPQDFENLLAHLFRKMEYIVEETQYSRDGGIDLIIRLEKFGLSHSWIVQAKRYSGPVGVKEVREYSSLKYRDRVDGVIIVTTSSFTKDGYEEAAKHNVKLIEGSLLVEMLNHYMPEGESTFHVNRPAETKKDRNEADTILRKGEEKLLTENVSMGNERFTMSITNKNIFLKRETAGIFSRKEQVEHRIEIKDVIGLHPEQKTFFLISGKKTITVYSLSSKKMSRIMEVLESLRPEYVRGEYLVFSSRKSSLITILTNKRISRIDITSGNSNDISIKNIVGVEIDGSLFKKKSINVLESANGMKKHSMEVDDAPRWKREIEQMVRMT